jgi:hypothetical protein
MRSVITQERLPIRWRRDLLQFTEATDRLLSREVIDEQWRLPESQLPPRPGPKDVFQQTMDRAYAHYGQKAGRKKVSRAMHGREQLSGHQSFLEALSLPEQLAVVFGNLNYQVENGGFQQWHGNRYYSDTIDYLREFIAKYGEHYPSFRKVEDLLDRFEAIPERVGDGDEDLDNILDGGFIEVIGELIGNDDWEELESHLGGTEYDRRYVDRSTADTLSDMLSIEVEEATETEDGLLKTPGSGKFVWVIKEHGKELARSETVYDGEDKAYEAAEADVDRLVAEAKDEENELWEKAREEVKEQIEKELRRSVEGDINRVLDELDKAYYAISNEVVEDVSSLLRTEFNVGHDIMGFISKAMSKARMAVAAALDRPIRSLKSGTAGILSRAAGHLSRQAEKIKPKVPPPSTRESADPIRRLLC